jgi:hypothetical protein
MMKNLLLLLLMIGLGATRASAQAGAVADPDSGTAVTTNNQANAPRGGFGSGIENALATSVSNGVKGDVINMLYPNPAGAAVNVVFDDGAGVHSVAVISMLGKPVKVYKVSGNSARVEIDDVPAGVYFLRLMNGQGQVIATRRFNHQ